MCEHQLFLVMLKLGSKIFRNFFVYRIPWTLNFSEKVSGHQLFLVTLNFLEFSNYRALCTLNFSELMSEHQHFFITLNLRSKIYCNFFVYRVLWTLNCSGEGGSMHQLSLIMLNLR